MPLVIIAFVKIIAISITTGILSLLTFLFARASIMHMVRSIIEGGLGPMPDGMDTDIDDDWLSLASGSNKPYIPPGGGEMYPDPFVPHEDIKPDGDDEVDAKVVIGMLILLIVWVVALSLVLSTFAGAMHHTIAQIYASTDSGPGCLDNNKPSPIQAIKRGYAKKSHIFGYMLLLSSVFIVVTFVTVGLPSVTMGGLGQAFFYMIYLVASFVICICTVAAIPTIVAEGKSPWDAFVRSMNLCRRYICFIFCTQLCYRFGMGLGIVIVALLLSLFGPIGLLVISTGLPLLIAVMDPVLSFVLYMSMRIQSEHVRQEEFARELALTDDDDVSTSAATGDYTLLLDAEVISDHDEAAPGVGSVPGTELELGLGLEAAAPAPEVQSVVAVEATLTEEVVSAITDDHDDDDEDDEEESGSGSGSPAVDAAEDIEEQNVQ